MESKINSKEPTIFDQFLFLFRFFYPSWRFFENFEHYPELSYKFAENSGGWTEWSLAFPKIKRSILGLISNPNGNALLAYNSLLDQIEGYIESSTDDKLHEVENSAAYQIIKKFVELEVLGKNKNATQYQFKLTARTQDPNVSDEYLVSPVYEVKK